jgi:Helix-turn-helix domain
MSRPSYDVEALRPGEPLATPAEVAEFLRKPPKTLAEWRSRGLGPQYFKIGRDVRYGWEAVLKWLADQAAGTRSA